MVDVEVESESGRRSEPSDTLGHVTLTATPNTGFTSSSGTSQRAARPVQLTRATHTRGRNTDEADEADETDAAYNEDSVREAVV